MTSPASAYAERQWEENDKRMRERRAQRLQFLSDMSSKVGFGQHEDGTWIDKQIHEHLEAAYQLLQVSKR